MSNAVDALKAKLAAVKGEKKTEEKAEKPAPKAAPAAKKAAPTKKPVKKPAKPVEKKVKKPAKKAPTKKATPKKTAKKSDRTFDRDRKGDGLRPIERKLISVVKGAGGTMRVIDIAHKIFGSNVKDEGPNSIRTIRNGVRKPIEYGLMKWSGRGEVKLTAGKPPKKSKK